MANNRVIIVGAGVGGLTAAVDLANKGFEVTLLEKAARPGGKMREIAIGNHRLDAGPTVFTLRRVFDELFDACGTSLESHVELEPLDLLARHAWDVKAHLDLYADLDRSADAIAEFAGADEARRYRSFCRDAQRVFNTLDEGFIRAPKPNMGYLMKSNGLAGLPGLLQMRPFSSLWKVLGEHFRDARLQQLFGRYSTYCGSSPFSASATLMLVAHVEQAGVWQIRGGMYRLTEALAALAVERGATVRCDCDVKRLLVDRSRVAGVELSSGEQIPADAVVLNADAGAIAHGHFGTEAISAIRKPPSERSLSAVTWSIVGETDGFPLAHHNVFFGRHYEAEFDNIFNRRELPNDPTVYVCAQDRHDAGKAHGQERLLCLANAPPVGDTRSLTADEISQFEAQAFEVMRRCGLEIRQEPDQTVITTPNEFERLFPGTGGALYGQPVHGWRAAFDRASARSRIPGLYLAGGSVHPGPGVPMAAQSGRQAAACLIKDNRSQ